MQSVIQKKSYGSVRIFWLDRELLRQRISQAVRNVAMNCPEVESIVLFGSVAEGREVASSDVDILLVVKGSEDRFVDRPLRYGSFFSDVGLGVDIFVYTLSEAGDVPLAKAALKSGRRLFQR